MVLNGRNQFVGSDGPALERALRDDARREHFVLRIVSSEPTSEGIDVKFAFAGNPSKPLDIIAVLADDADGSNVLRGENSGSQLQQCLRCSLHDARGYGERWPRAIRPCLVSGRAFDR